MASLLTFLCILLFLQVLSHSHPAHLLALFPTSCCFCGFTLNVLMFFKYTNLFLSICTSFVWTL